MMKINFLFLLKINKKAKFSLFKLKEEELGLLCYQNLLDIWLMRFNKPGFLVYKISRICIKHFGRKLILMINQGLMHFLRQLNVMIFKELNNLLQLTPIFFIKEIIKVDHL